MNRIWIRTIGVLVAAVAFCGGASPAKAAFTNGGFETGTFANWSTSGATSVVGTLGIVAPTEGTKQAQLTNGTGSVSQATLETFLGISSGSLDTLGNGDATAGSAIKQTITVSAGTVMTFNWNFLTNEGTPSFFNDFSFVSIVSGSTQTLANTNYNTGAFSPATGTGFSEMTGYKTFTHTFTAAGTYTIGVGVVDVFDTIVDSGLLVDNFKAVAVPAPPGVVLFAVGLIGLGGFRLLRRRTAVAVA